MGAKGILIPVGGNEDKGIDENESKTLEYIQEGILSRIVAESGGPKSCIVVVPTASRIPDQVSDTYKEAFKKLGCSDFHIMDIRSREQSELPENLEVMHRADCVMFSGGDQSRIVKFIGGTQLDKIIQDKYHNEHFVIAGTSAGAMCMSQDMITGGGQKETFVKGAVKMGRGMAFIPDFIIDSHFIQRRRFGRLAEAVSRYPKRIGVGLSEDTGLVIKNESECEVIGSGMIILFDPRDVTYNNLKEVEKGEAMSMTNLKTHILANGNRFDIKNGEIIFYLRILESQK